MSVVNKTVTVAIPVYNGSKFLEAAVRSIINQNYPISEILIVDDNSTDNSYDIIKKIITEFKDFNINYFKNFENIGYPKNWNKCFELCKTRYLVILHQDDELKKDCISKQINFLLQNEEFALVGGEEDFINVDGKIIAKREKKSLQIFNKGQIYEFVTKTGSYIPCSSVMFDMIKIRQVGGFDEDTIATDELFWPKILTKYPIAILGESLIYRRAHPDQTEYRDFILYEKEALDIYRKFYRIIDYEERIIYKKKLKTFLSLKFSKSWIGHIALNVAKRGKRWLVIKYIFRAIKINPLIILYIPRMWKSIAKIFAFFLGIKTEK